VEDPYNYFLEDPWLSDMEVIGNRERTSARNLERWKCLKTYLYMARPYSGTIIIRGAKRALRRRKRKGVLDECNSHTTSKKREEGRSCRGSGLGRFIMIQRPRTKSLREETAFFGQPARMFIEGRISCLKGGKKWKGALPAGCGKELRHEFVKGMFAERGETKLPGNGKKERV